MGLREMSACTTAYMMARNCGGCPVKDAALQYFLFGISSYPVFSAMTNQDIGSMRCLLDETAAICMYTGAELPWYYNLKKNHILVEDGPWKEMIQDELGRHGQADPRAEAHEQQPGEDSDSAGD